MNEAILFKDTIMFTATSIELNQLNYQSQVAVCDLACPNKDYGMITVWPWLGLLGALETGK